MSNRFDFRLWLRVFIGRIAWRVFLWSNGMTDEQYDSLVHAGCNPANGSPACEHGYNGICIECDAIMTPPAGWMGNINGLGADPDTP